MESLQINENRSERIIGIDLLKIVSMIMMVALHIIGTFGNMYCKSVKTNSCC